MARRHTAIAKDPIDREYVPQFADWLLSDYDVDRSRVISILEVPEVLRIWDVLSVWRRFRDGEAEKDRGHEYRLIRLRRALEELDSEEALRLFEASDQDKLTRRLVVFDYLREFEQSLYSVKELPGMLDAILNHLSRNRERLLRTGFPRTEFSRWTWIDWMISKLYLVKDPGFPSVEYTDEPEEADYLWDENGDRVYRLHWVGSDRTGTGGYEETPYIGNWTRIFKPSEIEKLEGDRERLLDLKMEVLRIIRDCIEWTNVGNMRDECFGAISRLLTADDAKFYLSLDQAYYSWDKEWSDGWSPAHSFHCGTLTQLIHLIGYFEKEATDGKFSDARDLLGDLVEEQVHWGRRLSVNYFQGIRVGAKDLLDSALDNLVTQDRREAEFWSAYYAWANGFLKSELKTSRGLKLKNIQIQHDMEIVNQYLERRYEVTGEFPDVEALHHPTRIVFGADDSYFYLTIAPDRVFKLKSPAQIKAYQVLRRNYPDAVNWQDIWDEVQRESNLSERRGRQESFKKLFGKNTKAFTVGIRHVGPRRSGLYVLKYRPLDVPRF